MLDKLKKLGSDVKEKTGRSVEYAKGKTQGFKHPEAVEQYIQVYRWNKEQIPKLYSRVSSLTDHNKDTANAEKKLAAEFGVLGGHENEHPELAKYMRAMADAYQQISDEHLIFQARLEEIKSDWKTLDSKDLTEIEKISDKANRALTDARYWRTHSNPAKLADAESKYKQYSAEFVDQINRLREKKETLFAEYIKRIAEAQVSFYRAALSASENFLATLETIGPVIPAPIVPLDINFDVSDGDEKSSSASGYAAGSRPVPPTPARPLPQPGAKQARALYQFDATAPDELSFREGDILTIVNTGGDWWTAELNGRRGLIPSNYVQML